MAKKLLALLLTLMLAVTCASFSVTVSAADKAVYVEQGETGGDGSEDNPFGTIEEAFISLEGGAGTIYIYGLYDLSGFKLGYEWDGMVTIQGVTADSMIKLQDSQGALFQGPVTMKDIKFDIGKYACFHLLGDDFIMDPGNNASFGDSGMIHFPAFQNNVYEGDAYLELDSGTIAATYLGGGYNTSYANGVMGNSTFVMNGGVTTLNLASDSFMETHTGLSIGGNMNVVINGGTVKAINNKEITQPEIMGALNIIFNNGMEAPEQFAYPETALMGTYIVYSDKGGTVMPTEDPGVFDVKADKGKVAMINGKQVLNGTVELNEGTTEVTWVPGEQPESDDAIEIKLVIGSAELLKNGETTPLDVPAQIIDDRTMVPLRAIFEALGASVEWDDATKTVTSVKDDTTVKLTIGENKLTVNGEEKTLDVPGQIVESRTLVPARAVAESFGCTVEWDAPSKTVTITK